MNKKTSCLTQIQLLFSTILLLIVHFAGAQSQEKLYSLLIVNFARNIEWPAPPGTSEFTIGVLEYPPLVSELSKTLSATKVGDKNIHIREFASAEEIRNCNILFIPAYKAKLMPYILNKLSASSTLIVTNKIDMAKKGSNINFILANGKLQYEINCKSIEERGMKISSRLKGMGILVE